MSKATKRKYVVNEVLETYALPEGAEKIVKVTAARGNNLHEVVTPEGETFLVSMPTKFRRNIWIKIGDYVIVTPIEEGNKVKAEITRILYADQIKYIKEEKMWPENFDTPMLKEKEEELIPKDMLPPSDSEEEYEEEEEEEEEDDEDDERNRQRKDEIVADNC